MNGDLPLGRIAGVRIGLNWSVLLIAGIYVLALATQEFPNAYPGLTTAAYWAAGVGGALLFFGSLLVHELGHAFVARHEKIAVRGVTLWLLGGFTELAHEPTTPGSQFRVAIAGPLSNGLLAGLFWLIHLALGGSAAFNAGSGAVGLIAGIAVWLAVLNGLLAVLNLLPAAPLDGGQILLAVLWAVGRDRARASSWSAIAGMGLGGVLIGAGVLQLSGSTEFQGVWLMIVGWWILGTARRQYAGALADDVFTHVTLGQIMQPNPPLIPEWVTVDEVVARYGAAAAPRAFPVQADDGRITGLLTAEQIRAVDPWHRAQLPVSQVAFPLSRLTWAQADELALPAARRLAGTGVPALLVLWPDQRIAGIVGEPELERAFQQRRRHLIGSPR